LKKLKRPTFDILKKIYYNNKLASMKGFSRGVHKYNWVGFGSIIIFNSTFDSLQIIDLTHSNFFRHECA
jgi:hypothetical protein